VEGSRAPAGCRAAAGVPDRREERTALDAGGAGLLFAGLPADRPGRLGAGFPAGSAAGRPIRAPRELPPPPALPPRALGGHTCGQRPNPGTRGGQRGGRSTPGGAGGAAGLDRPVRLADVPAASSRPPPLSCPTLSHHAPAQGGLPGPGIAGTQAGAATAATDEQGGAGPVRRWDPSWAARADRPGPRQQPGPGRGGRWPGGGRAGCAGGAGPARPAFPPAQRPPRPPGRLPARGSASAGRTDRGPAGWAARVPPGVARPTMPSAT
jgi:hypothetical protein